MQEAYKWALQATSIVRAKRRDEFLREYDFAVRRIRDVAPMSDWASPAKRAGEALALADAVQDLLDRLNNLSQPLKHWISKGSALGRPADIEALESLEKEARFHSVAPDKKAGAPPRSAAKEYAAREAQRLLLVFTNRERPTSAKDKRFRDLSSLLYQEATGASNADLTSYCKKVFNNSGTHAL